MGRVRALKPIRRRYNGREYEIHVAGRQTTVMRRARRGHPLKKVPLQEAAWVIHKLNKELEAAKKKRGEGGADDGAGSDEPDVPGDAAEQ